MRGMARSSRQWVLLAYRLPREPSTPRIALWRRLRRLGAVQILDGLVALPLDDRTREQFEWLAQEVEDAGGEAGVWISEPTTAAQQRELVARSREAVAADYRTIVDAAEVARQGDVVSRRRAAVRLRRTLTGVASRDFFPPPERKQAERAVEQLVALAEAER
jgi:Protein ChrB, N-terminal